MYGSHRPYQLVLKEFEYVEYEEGYPAMEPIEYESLLSLSAVESYTGLSASTIQAAVEIGSFPSPVDFNGDAVWLSAEVAKWLENLPHSPSNSPWGKAA